MSKLRITLIASVAGIIGLAAGAAAASWFWMDFNAEFNANWRKTAMVERTQADIVTKVAVLKRLREGHYAEAIEFQEILLDGDLIGAGALARDGTRFDDNLRRTLELERRARERSGYQPENADVRAAVQEAFRLLPPTPAAAR